MGQAQAKDKEAEPKKRLTIPMLLPSESGNKIDGSDNDEGGVNDGRTGRAVPIPIPNLPAGLEQTIVETAASAPAELKWDQVVHTSRSLVRQKQGKN